MILESFINKMTLNPRRLFLIDCLGAVLSIFLIGFVLVRLESVLGMPRAVLYKLVFIPCLFALYSFICFIRMPENWRPFLKAIAIGNTIYCLITIGLIFSYYQELSVLGIIYFIGEIPVMLSLVYIEWQTALGK